MQSILDFIMAHQGLIGGIGVGVLDFIFAMKSDWKTNGLLHFIYVQFSGLKDKQ